MSGYTVEVRTGILAGGYDLHTWLHITKPDGTAEAWGLHPATDSLGNIIKGPGDVRPENIGSRYTATSGPLPMSQDEYSTLVSNIAAEDAVPPN